MPSRFDVWALARARDEATLSRFLARWAKAGVDEELRRALRDPERRSVVELEPLDHRLPGLVRVVFSGDGRLILGLSVDDDDPGDGPLRSARELLEALREDGCALGLIAQDDPSPESADDLRRRVDALAARGERAAYFR